jgi:serine/threonine protein kinase
VAVTRGAEHELRCDALVPSRAVSAAEQATREVAMPAPPPASNAGGAPAEAMATAPPEPDASRASLAPIDDPDEETINEIVANEVADEVADEEPTTIRPTPLPADLAPWAALERDTRPDAQPRSRGRIGKYEVFTRLARGAFGTVYTAYDPSLDRSVALKVLRPTHLSNQDIVQRFLQEARATARVVHPGIVTIHDCGMVETRGGQTAFIAMELLSGESLSRRLDRVGRLSPAAACEIARQVASALEAAHCVDVLHRDLKPDNIFLVPDPAMPSGERVKVLDFGLAKLGATGNTQLETVFGTPRYMSPEQTRSATQIDHRSDIYALGCIVFELVAGRPVFDGDVRQLLDRHQRVPPPSAASLAPEVPPGLDELIGEMLAKDPMDRPQTMGAVQRSLVSATTGSHRRPPSARPPSVPPVLGSPPDGVLALASVEVSPDLLRPPGPTTSGEIVVPAAPRTFESPPPPEEWSAAGDRRRALLYLCVVVVAMLAAIGVAATT